MAGMSANLKLEGKVKLKNMFTSGKTLSICISAPNGPGELILAPPMMADIMPLHLDGSVEWIVGEKCFVGHTPGVQRTDKLSGHGVAFITSLGAIHGVHLQAGQEYIIEYDHVVARHASMNCNLETLGSAWSSSMCSAYRFCGPGTVYMQTRNPGALAAYMRSIGVGNAR